MPFSYERPDSRLPTNTPVLSLMAGAIMLTVGVTIVLSGQAGERGGLVLLGVISANLPGVIGAIYAERTGRDVRNGVMPEQTRKGIEKAIEDGTLQGGVTAALESHQVVTRDGPLAAAAIKNAELATRQAEALQAQTAALARLLEAATSRRVWVRRR